MTTDRLRKLVELYREEALQARLRAAKFGRGSHAYDMALGKATGLERAAKLLEDSLNEEKGGGK